MKHILKIMMMTAILLGGLAPRPVSAATLTSSFTVTATVITACLIASLPLAFGNYDPTSGSATTGSTSVTATCTHSAPYVLSLNDGAGAGADATGGAQGRKMTLVAGSTTLGYNLYKDSSFTTAWGSTTGLTVSDTGNGVAQPHTIYGRLPAQQTAGAGAYLDTVTATLTF